MNVNLKTKQRFQVLQEIYKQTDGNTLAGVSIEEICDELGIPEKDVNTIEQYLIGEGLIEAMTMMHISITHKGVKEIENAQKHPEKETTYFPAMNNIIYVENMNNSQIQQGSQNSSQTYTNTSTDDVVKILEEVLQIANKADYPTDQKERVIENIENIQHQIAIPEEYRNKAILQKAWSYLTNTGSIITIGEFLLKHKDKILPLIGIK